MGIFAISQHSQPVPPVASFGPFYSGLLPDLPAPLAKGEASVRDGGQQQGPEGSGHPGSGAREQDGQAQPSLLSILFCQWLLPSTPRSALHCPRFGAF